MAEERKKTGYPSIDKPWLKYYNANAINAELKKCTIYQYIYDSNKNHKEDIAIQFFGNKITYRQLFEHVDNCARALTEYGIKSGDCINLLTAGTPEAVFLVLACSRIGAIANFINPLFDETQMVDRINDTKSNWLFVLDVMYKYINHIVKKLCSKQIVIVPISNSFAFPLKTFASFKSDGNRIIKENGSNGIHHIMWNDFYIKGVDSETVIPAFYAEETPVVMVYSSGSTGASKGILHTNESINATLLDSLSSGLFYQRGMSFLQMIPIWFSTGIVQCILLPLSLGIYVVMEPRFDYKYFVKDMIKYKPTFALVQTSFWMYAIQDLKFQKVKLQNLLYPFTGGEKILPNVEKTINEFLERHGCSVSLIKGYGMCELCGKATDSIVANKLGSVGIPMSHIVIGIFNPITNEELSYGEHGEIRVISPAHMKEYYNNPKATNDFFWNDKLGNTWGCTGDIGYIDEDGMLFVLGRASDSFLSENSEIVYFFDIEEKIILEEYVDQCKVVDINTESGKKIVAHIVIKAGKDTNMDVIARIDSRLKKTLPNYMVPNYYKIRNYMPINKNGKLDVEALKNDKESLICL